MNKENVLLHIHYMISQGCTISIEKNFNISHPENQPEINIVNQTNETKEIFITLNNNKIYNKKYLIDQFENIISFLKGDDECP